MNFDKIKPVATRVAGALLTAIFSFLFVGYIVTGELIDLRKALLWEVFLVVSFLFLLYNIHPFLARKFNRENLFPKAPLFKKVLEFVTVVAITLALFIILFSLPFSFIYPEIAVPEERIRISYFMIIAVSLIYYYYFERERAQLEIRQSVIRSERMGKENTEAQLLALKNQISPHFLFNSFNVLDNLMELDEEKADRFLDQLSRIYQVFLENADHSLVSLAKDLELAEAYIGLLKTRFSQNLKFELQIQEEDKKHLVPTGITQMLIENAIKHNGFSRSRPLTVEIFSRSDPGSLVVKNNIQARQEPVRSTGVGLKNIVNRYALLSDKPVVVQRNEQDFIVILPLLKP